MEALSVALIIISIILFLCLCAVGSMYFDNKNLLITAQLVLENERAIAANATLAAQTASAKLAAQTLADAQSKSAALQAAKIAMQNALSKQQTDDAVALAQAVAAQKALDQTQLHEALANQSAQNAETLKAALEAQKQTDKEAMAAAIESQKKTDLDAKVAALAQQANQHSADLAAALLEQKNKAAKSQADAIAASLSNQQTINAQQLADALAQAKKAADDALAQAKKAADEELAYTKKTASEAQTTALNAQKSINADAVVTAATVAVVTAAQATALAAVNTTNAILTQILTIYQTTLNAVYTQSIILAINRVTGVFLPINSPYSLLMTYVNENLYQHMNDNKTHHMAAFLLGQINTNYITQFQVYQTTAMSQYTNTTKATTSNMATAAANAAVAASITATGLSSNVINMCNNIMSIITQTTLESQQNTKDNTKLLLQTVGISEILNIIYQSIGDMQKLMAYGPGIFNVSLSNVPSYIASITPITVKINTKFGIRTEVLPLTGQQLNIIRGHTSSFVAARNTVSSFISRRSGFMSRRSGFGFGYAHSDPKMGYSQGFLMEEPKMGHNQLSIMGEPSNTISHETVPLLENQAVMVIHNTEPMSQMSIVESVSYSIQNSMSIITAPGVKSDGDNDVIITDQAAAEKGAAAAMLATILNMRSIVSATLTCLNMWNKYITNDYELMLSIINGTGLYINLKTQMVVPKYSLELAVSLSKNQIGQVTDITNNPVNYIPVSVNLWTEFGNQFIIKSGGYDQFILSNPLPAVVQEIKNNKLFNENTQNLKKYIQDAIKCATKANELISPDIPLMNLVKNSPCDYTDILENINSSITGYEFIKSSLFTYLIHIAQ